MCLVPAGLPRRPWLKHLVLFYVLDEGLSLDDTPLDGATKWLYAIEKGAEAIFDKLYTDKVVEQYKGGVKYDGRAGAFDRAASFVRMQLAGDAGHTDALLGRRRKSGDAEVYGRASRRRPSNALRNCLKNLEFGTELNTTEAPDEGASSASEGQFSIETVDNETVSMQTHPSTAIH